MIKSKLSELLSAKNTTADKMIEKTHLGKADIRELLDGSAREIHFDVLEAVCDFLGCEVGDLLKHQD